MCRCWWDPGFYYRRTDMQEWEKAKTSVEGSAFIIYELCKYKIVYVCTCMCTYVCEVPTCTSSWPICWKGKASAHSPLQAPELEERAGSRAGAGEVWDEPEHVSHHVKELLTRTGGPAWRGCRRKIWDNLSTTQISYSNELKHSLQRVTTASGNGLYNPGGNFDD